MKKFKLNFALAAFILGSVVALTQSSFTAAKTSKKYSGTNYVFNGHALTDDTNAANYSMEGTTPPDCDDVPTLPCVINVPAGTTLTSWLAARTATQIRDQATEKKSQ